MKVSGLGLGLKDLGLLGSYGVLITRVGLEDLGSRVLWKRVQCIGSWLGWLGYVGIVGVLVGVVVKCSFCVDGGVG